MDYPKHNIVYREYVSLFVNTEELTLIKNLLESQGSPSNLRLVEELEEMVYTLDQNEQEYYEKIHNNKLSCGWYNFIGPRIPWSSHRLLETSLSGM